MLGFTNQLAGDRTMTLDEIEQRLPQLERRVDEISLLQNHIETTLNQFGSYKDRNEAELTLMKGQVEAMVSAVESLVNAAEYKDGAKNGKNLLRRLRNNHTRINRQLKAK